MLGKAIEELNEGQEKTTEELIALRRQFKELADELKQERLAFIEYMRESGARDQETEDDEPVGGADEEEKKDRKEGNNTLKSILLGVVALGAAIALLKDELVDLLPKAITDGMREWWQNRTDQSFEDIQEGGTSPIEVAGATQTGQIVKREAKLTALAIESALASGKGDLSQGSQIEYTGKDGEIKKATVTGGNAATGRVQVTADVDGKSVTYTVDKEKVLKSRSRQLATKAAGMVASSMSGKKGSVVAGTAFAAMRGAEGDQFGAVLEMVSAVGSMFKGFGTVFDAGATALLIYRDLYKSVYGAFPADHAKEVGPDQVVINSMNLKPVLEEAMRIYMEQYGSAYKRAQQEFDEMPLMSRIGYSMGSRTGGGMETYLAQEAQRIMESESSFNQEYRPSGDVVIPNLVDPTFAGGPLRPEFLPANVTPAGGASAVVGDIITKQTQQSVASGGAPIVIESNTSNTAVSTGGGAGTSRDAVPDPTSMPSYVLDAYAQPGQN